MKRLGWILAMSGLIVFPTLAEYRTAEDLNKIMAERYNIIEDTEEDEWISVNLHISYYTDLIYENSSHGAVDAKGNKLKFGTIAIPRDLPLGTEFKIEGYDNIFYGTDRGSKKYIKWLDKEKTTMKIDMFIPRNKGESESAYFKRVNMKGITKTTGKYKLPKEE